MYYNYTKSIELKRIKINSAFSSRLYERGLLLHLAKIQNLLLVRSSNKRKVKAPFSLTVLRIEVCETEWIKAI